MALSHSAPVILVIDHSEIKRYEMSRHLTRIGWTVKEAGTAREGLEAVHASPSVIIVGGDFSDMAGAELCRQIKNGPLSRKIPLLNTSATVPKSDDLGLAGDQNVDAYLTEPVDPKELVATIKALLRLRSAEAKSEINAAKLEAVINSMIEGVITTDREGNFVTMNPAALRIYGFSSLEEVPAVLDDQAHLIERTHLDGSPLPREEWPLFRAVRGEVVRGYEMRIVRRDTGKSWIGSFNATLIRTADAVSDSVILTVLDITARKADEAALRGAKEQLNHHAEELEKKVQERTASLREAIGQMEEFSYTVSHDLRAPLRSIKGYAEVLINDHAGKLKGDAARFLERIVENSNRMERLVTDVLTISRISSTNLKLEPIDLNPLLDSIVTEYPNLHSSVAQIAIEPLPRIVGHESLCIQIFANLLSNAAKFVRPSTIPQIRVWAEPAGNYVRINLQDNGIGIGTEFHQKIFGMFERLDPENYYGGTGIGLAIVRRAVEKMNGRVGLVSDGEHGSLFWVELPRAN